jgi:pimeloyl-ACP methyl ester carboxylesterase
MFTAFRRFLTHAAFAIPAALFSVMPTSATAAGAAGQPTRPTIVLVHGAFADSSSWNGVTSRLLARGYPVVAAANPLRGVQSDAASVATVLAAIDGPVVLVGHSYGGAVISAAANGQPNVRALVFVAAFAPLAGESAAELAGRFPGGTLGSALAKPVPLPDGSHDLSIRADKFHSQFAADVPASTAALMAVSQRPITDAALNERAGEPAWKTIPSWFIYGDADKNIPAAGLSFMAQRAGAKQIVAVRGASHVVMSSHPDAVAKMIETAARARPWHAGAP